MTYILNIANVIKMIAKELKDVIYESYYRRITIYFRKQLLFNEISKEKDFLLNATKLRLKNDKTKIKHLPIKKNWLNN